MNSQYKSSQKLLKELKSEWEHHHIPQEIQNIYLESFESLSKPQLHQFLSQEISSYKSHSSLILLCLSSILAQNESLSSIKTLNQTLQLTKNWMHIEEVIVECGEIFEAYRNLTINLVENIILWKKQMSEELLSPGVDLFFSGKSYLESHKVLLEFLLDSQFSRVFHFVKNDPFLVKCSKIVETSQNFIEYKNQCFLTISLEAYEKVAGLEQALAFDKALQAKNLTRSFSIKKSTKINEEEIKNLTPVRSSSTKKMVSQSRKNLRGLSLKAVKPKKSDYKYIDKVLESQLNRVEESCVESECSNLPSREKKFRPSNLNHLNYEPEYSDVSQSLSSKEPRNQLSSKRLPPLQKPRVKKEVEFSFSNEPKSESSQQNRAKRIYLDVKTVKNDEQDIKSFISIERKVEIDQMAEEILTRIIKIYLKREDLYSLAYGVLNISIENYKSQIKTENNLKVSEVLAQELIEFYLKCSNLSGLVEETISTYIENNRKVSKIAETFELSEHFMNTLLTSYLSTLNFEEIVEDCISYSLNSHKAAISALTKIQSTTEKQLNPLLNTIIEDFLLNYLENSLISEAMTEYQEDEEFNNLNSEKILSEKFANVTLDPSGIQILLYSEVKIGSSECNDVETSKEMVEIGSRPIVIAALLQKNHDFFSAVSKNRLQTDLVDLLQIYTSLPDNDRPALSNNFSVSLKLLHKAILTSNSPFFLFKNINFNTSDSFTSFTIQTENPLFSVFFISSSYLLQELNSELAFQKSDLFSKVESILNFENFSTSLQNVLVPFFHKQLAWRLSWLQGLQLTEKNRVSGCIESLFINFSSQNIESDTIPIPCFSLDPPFIFGKNYIGLIHNQLYTALKVPFCVCLVNGHNVIRK